MLTRKFITILFILELQGDYSIIVTNYEAHPLKKIGFLGESLEELTVQG